MSTTEISRDAEIAVIAPLKSRISEGADEEDIGPGNDRCKEVDAANRANRAVNPRHPSCGPNKTDDDEDCDQFENCQGRNVAELFHHVAEERIAFCCEAEAADSN